MTFTCLENFFFLILLCQNEFIKILQKKKKKHFFPRFGFDISQRE